MGTVKGERFFLRQLAYLWGNKLNDQAKDYAYEASFARTKLSKEEIT
jgi:hypothetical protein